MSEPPHASPGDWSHIDPSGQARMVDVGDKTPTPRRAVAVGRVRMRPETLAAIRSGGSAKGNVLGAARLAGIQAAKQTAFLIPLCHPLPVDKIAVDFGFPGDDCLAITAEVAVTAKTGVEMEALTAVSVAALTVYDMCKAVDPDMVIEEIRLEEKIGGKKGHYRHPRKTSKN
ncbi:MAG: cyclic pyranopterin monophosphate synthase MoaC [Planctomycetes bacterium]|nr:cyclic pyranopterin monophosphate synthase MoaC [Planctomycetota bacterium]